MATNYFPSDRRRASFLPEPNTDEGVYVTPGGFWNNVAEPWKRVFGEAASGRGLFPSAGQEITNQVTGVVAPVKTYFMGQPSASPIAATPAMQPIVAPATQPPSALTNAANPAGSPFMGRVRSLPEAAGRATFLGANQFASPDSRAGAMALGDVTSNMARARAGGYYTNEDQRGFVANERRMAGAERTATADRGAALLAEKYKAEVATLAQARQRGSDQNELLKLAFDMSIVEQDDGKGGMIKAFDRNRFNEISSLIDERTGADVNGDGKVSPEEDEYNKVAEILAEDGNKNSPFELTPAQREKAKQRKAELAYKLGLA